MIDIVAEADRIADPESIITGDILFLVPKAEEVTAEREAIVGTMKDRKEMMGGEIVLHAIQEETIDINVEAQGFNFVFKTI